MSSTQTPRRATVCGIEITLIGLKPLIARICEDVEKGVGNWIVTLNLDLLSRGLRDPEYLASLRKADLVLADGMPIVWACRRKEASAGPMERTTGADLTREILPLVPADRVGIVGGTNPRLALTKLGLDHVDEFYINDGKISFEDEFIHGLVQGLRGRRLVLVALGAPKQERLIERLRPHMPEATFIGVGGSFEFIAGITKRAPLWMQRSGLEWTYRLALEPRRLWKRYFVECPRGAWALLLDTRQKRPT